MCETADCRETFLEPGQKGLSYEAPYEKSHIADSLWQIDGFNKPYAISHMPYANCSEASEGNEVDGPFSAGSLGNGIGSIGQAQEIPGDQEHNADELRKRRRDMEQPAT
jgi:hypothetical protein